MRLVRKLRIVGDIAYVPLTKGYEAIIDAADAPMIGAWNWSCLVAPCTVYAQRFQRIKGKRHTITMHRALLNAPDGFVADHIDSNGLNNRRSNLRIATRAQNKQNSRIASNNTSGFKGVSWHKRDLAWYANIKADNKFISLGRFDTAESAHAAYCDAAARFFGEFARFE